MPENGVETFDREMFTARALGYLCLHFADLGEKTVLERADFLMGLGLPRREAAVVLGSTDESLRVRAYQRDKQAVQGKGKAKGGGS